MSEKHKKDPSDRNRKFFHIFYLCIIILLIIVIILLLLRSCGEKSEQGDSFGDYEISTYEQQESVDTTKKNGTIAFAGFRNYKVSKKSPKIRLENPASNRVEMVFTLTDQTSGEMIVKTEKVQPGKYVYINIVDFYKTRGTYDVFVKITTFDPDTGQQKNGLDQAVKVQVI